MDTPAPDSPGKAKKIFSFRTRLLVDKGFQLSVISHSFWLTGICLVAVFVAVRYMFHSVLIEATANGLMENPGTIAFVEEVKGILAVAFAIIIIPVLLTITLGGLYLSHKVAGPMLNLKRFFEAIAQGETPDPLRFRNRDYFKEIPDVVNRAVEKLREK